MRIFAGSGRAAISVLSAAAIFLAGISLKAQEPEARITKEITTTERTVLRGSHSPVARAENETGRVAASTRLQGVGIVFSRTATQEADLQALIAAQQDPASPLYQQWLTPEEFGARFGVAQADIQTVTSWLEQQGFTVESVSRSKNQITFSGSVQQVEQAFGTELHYYKVNGEQHFAPNADLMLPATLAPLVESVTNLSSLRPKPHVKQKGPQPASEYHFTSGQSGNHFLSPKDVATIYNITPAYNAGLTGSGEKIAVVGQSEIVMTDIEHFQSAAGFSVKDPTRMLVTSSGTATIVSGDEAESDLDLEYAGTIAPGATILFVYTGNNANFNVWNSLEYAIKNNVAPIISMSYGLCELQLGQASYNTLNNTYLAQAATQGQTVISASGDSGSADCVGTGNVTTAASLGVDFPATSQYVTGMGGSEFPTADVAAGNSTFWSSNGTTDVLSSALSYIPEQVWNDSASGTLSSGGGGISMFTSRPSWQAGVSGISAGTMRLVPDISLSASPDNAGYLYCSSDTSTKVTGSCSNGFRDSNSANLTVAGGTSFDAPIFAGMMAIINQKMGKAQGVANTKLYSLASNATTYASAFHDITSGNNGCSGAGITVCPTTSPAFSVYAAGTGYDMATGLGSINFNNLLTAWSGSSSSLTASKTTVSAATTTPASGASDSITITVASAGSSTTTPTGTVSVSVDGTVVNGALALAAGSATYAFSSTVAGAHTIAATYSGDTTYSSSSGTVTVTVSASSKSFTVSATSVTVAAGGSGTSTVTVTPQGGYTGTISWAVSSSPSSADLCFSIPNTSVSSASPVAPTLTIKTSASACGTAAITRGSGKEFFAVVLPEADTRTGGRGLLLGLAQSGLALLAIPLLLFGGRGRRVFRVAGCAALLLAAGLVNGGCSSSSTTTLPSGNAAKGTYTVTLTGTDTTTSSITASTSMMLTID